MNEAMDTLKKERTGGRRSGVCSVVSGRSAVLVAVIWTIWMAVAPVDVLDALVPGGAFELVRRAFPFCIFFCSANICAKNTHIFTHIQSLRVRIHILYRKRKARRTRTLFSTQSSVSLFTWAFLYLIDSFCCLLSHHEKRKSCVLGNGRALLLRDGWGRIGNYFQPVYRARVILYVESDGTLVKNNPPYWLMRITMSRAVREKCVVTISVAFLRDRM